VKKKKSDAWKRHKENEKEEESPRESGRFGVVWDTSAMLMMLICWAIV
jgi:hypothetical protein